MSHITNGKLKVLHLDDLETAALERGLVLHRGQTTHKWYGRFMGDSAVPEGMDPKDYGKCAHALALKDAQAGDYEIGVVPALDGGEGYDLVLDTWGQTRLLAAVGPDLNILRREYAAAVATRKANEKLRQRGFVAHRTNLANGGIRVRLVKR